MSEKQLTKEYTEGVLSGCTKTESLRTRWYVLPKTKTWRIIIEVFHFHATCFILRFLLRLFFKTVGEILHLITLYPKFIFQSALKKTFIVLEDRSYQTQYFAKIFPSPLASTLHIHFYLHLKESSENALWIAIGVKSETFSAPESAPKTVLKTTYFILFLKNVTKNLEKKLMIVFVLIELISLTHIFFPACYFFCYWGKFPSHAWLEKNCVYEAALLFVFPETLQIVCIC